MSDIPMPAFAVVEAFDVVEHIRSSFVSGAVVTTFDALSFKRRKKAFDHRIDITAP